MKGEPPLPRGLLCKGVAVASHYRLAVEKLDCTWTCAAWGKNLGWGWAGARGWEIGGKKKSLTQYLWNVGSRLLSPDR